MGATQYDGIYLVIFSQQVVDAFLDEIISTRTVKFIVFHQRYPHGAGFTGHNDVWVEFLYLKHIRLRLDGSWSCHNTYMPRLREMTDTFSRRTDDAKHPT